MGPCPSVPHCARNISSLFRRHLRMWNHVHHVSHGFLPPAINSVGLEPRLCDVSAQAGCQVRPELSVCFVSFHVLGLHDHAFGTRVCFALGSWPLSASIDMPMSSIAVKECWQLSFDHPLYRQRSPPPACISSHYFGTGIAHTFPGPCTWQGLEEGCSAFFCCTGVFLLFSLSVETRGPTLVGFPLVC